MATDVRRLGLGAVALLVSSIVIILAGVMNTPVPDLLAGVAALGLAGGALLIGMSENDAAV